MDYNIIIDDIDNIKEVDLFVNINESIIDDNIYKYVSNFCFGHIFKILNNYDKVTNKKLSDIYLLEQASESFEYKDIADKTIVRLCELMNDMNYFTDFNIPGIITLEFKNGKLYVNQIFNKIMASHYHYDYCRLYKIMTLNKEKVFLDYYTKIYGIPFANNIICVYENLKILVFRYKELWPSVVTIFNNIEDVKNDFTILKNKIIFDINDNYELFLNYFCPPYDRFYKSDTCECICSPYTCECKYITIPEFLKVLYMLYLFTKNEDIIIYIFIKVVRGINKYNQELCNVYNNLKIYYKQKNINLQNILFGEYIAKNIFSLQDYIKVLTNLNENKILAEIKENKILEIKIIMLFKYISVIIYFMIILMNN